MAARARRSAGIGRLVAAVALLCVLVGGSSVLPTDTGSGVASAATFAVTNGNNSGPGSLRQALIDASASAGADTISVSVGVGTITLTAQMAFASADAVTIQGNGATITQTAAFSVLDSTGAGRLSLFDVTVTGGRASCAGPECIGGGVHTTGPLSLTRCVVRGNAAPGGSVGYGGGVASQSSTVELVDSVVESNTASGGGAAGGGVFAAYGVSLTQSTVRGNQVSTGADSLGGGIWTLYGPVILVRSTVSGNTLQGGWNTLGAGVFVHAPSTDPAVQLVNSTVSGNTITGGSSRGGGIYTCRDSCTKPGNVQLTYSTVAGNSAANGANVYLASATAKLYMFASVIALRSGGGANCFKTASTTSYGYNVVDDISCLIATTGDLIGSVNTQLGSLGANGGPTQTRLPAWTSPLLNRVPSGSCGPPSPLPSVSTDQRGTARPQPAGGACDTGAVELSDPTAPVVTPSLSPPANGFGWHRTDVAVSWAVSDPESGIASSSGCGTTAVTNETAGVLLTCLATNRLGVTTSKSVTIKLDKTAPAIAGSRAPAANGAGWNQTDVTASFSCTDSLSGIASCGPTQVLSAEGASQSATGQAADIAGNTASATVSGISIDKTPPSLTGTPTTSPNASGWYSADVTIDWSCSDPLSGLSGPCPADETVSGEGAHLSAAASVSDLAGNLRPATSQEVKIDRTPPLTTASAVPYWTNRAVTVSLSAEDALSGIEHTYYRLDGGSQTEGTSVAVSGEGIHTIRFWSTDLAGNGEDAQEALVRIDLTAPTIRHTQAPEPNAAGWNDSPVTITFICADPLSGIRRCTAVQLLSTEGASQRVTGEAEDNAGNTATDHAFVSIDRTAPQILATVDRTPDRNGWYRADVQVSFTCSDALSGIASCPETLTLGGGASQSASGTARDTAGNSAQALVSGISIDKTPPTLVGTPTTSPNAGGWYAGDVTIHWTASDGLSGLDPATMPDDTLVTGEGSDLSATASVFDLAGNEARTTVRDIKIDRTDPTIAAERTPLPNSFGWTNSDVTVTFTCEDALSGIASCTAPVIRGEGAGQSANGTATDRAGHTAQASVSGIKVDKTPPTLTGAPTQSPNANGWYADDVAIHWSASDALAGVDPSTEPSDSTITGEGDDLGAQASVYDRAGNSTQGSVSGIKIDRTPPSVQITGVEEGVYYTLGAVPVAACETTDWLSGVGREAALSVSGGTSNGVGEFIVRCSGALDRAGNSAAASLAYEVGYRFSGFLLPVDNPPTVNLGRIGRTYPLKFRLLDADGRYISALSAVLPLKYKPVSCGAFSGDQTDALETAATGGTSLRYDAAANQYVYNWKTPATPGCYTVLVNTDDGETHEAHFQLS